MGRLDKVGQAVLLHATALFLCFTLADAVTPEPLYSEKPVVARMWPNQTKCYHFSLDSDQTRNVVYWKDAKVYFRLEPCAGVPHMRASVYGCPSDGNLINWEYQSDKARNDLRVKGEKVPADWEWPGDLETLSIDVTHRNFYVEISYHHQPLRTNVSLYDLETRLRAKNYMDEAEKLVDIYSENLLGTANQAQKKALLTLLTQYQELLMPEAHFILTATLHDASVVPTEKVYPMTNAAGWNRSIAHVAGPEIVVGEGVSKDTVQDPALTGGYLIAFWPPSRTSLNLTSPANSTNETAAVSTSPKAAAARRLLSSLAEGAAVKFGDVSVSLEELGEHVHDAARRVLAIDDVIFGGAGEGGEDKDGWDAWGSGEMGAMEKEMARVKEEAAELALRETERQLHSLRGVVPDFDQHAAKAPEEVRRAGRRSAEAVGKEAVTVRQAQAPQQGRPGVIERAEAPVRDEDLEFMVYWTEVTDTFKERWGTMTDAMGGVFTRLLDNPCGGRDLTCGVKQTIGKSEFAKLDRSQDGLLSREEYEQQYTSARQAYDDGFKAGLSFSSILGNSTGISVEQWIDSYDGTQAMLDATVKDPLMQTFWTVCSVNGSGTRIVPSGNVTRDPSRAVWEPWTQFGQLAGDGRLTRSISGLRDDDNNIYIINILVRHRVTGEYAAYKPHIIQKETPKYVSHKTSATDYNIIIGVCSAFGVIFLLLVSARIFTVNKKLRPSLVIKKAGKM